MADLNVLLRGLVTYEATLNSHNDSVTEAFDTLKTALRRLGAVYEGTGAKEFKSHWARTQANFEDYIAGSKAIRLLLVERIEALRAADRAGGL